MSREFDFTRGWPFAPVPARARITPQELEMRVSALSQAPVFAGLSGRQRRSLAKVTSVHRYEPGRVIVREGSSGRSFFVILEGQVKVVVGARTVTRLRAGEFFGEISLLDGDPRTASVVADTATACLSLTGTDFTPLLSSESSISITILREVARRLRAAEAPPAG